MINFIFTTLLLTLSTLSFASEASSDEALMLQGEELESIESIDFEDLEEFTDDSGEDLEETSDFALSTNTFFVHNKCWADIWVAVRYYDNDGHWITKGWYKVEAYKKRAIVSSKNRYIFYTAYSTQGNYKWGSDNYSWSVREAQINIASIK